MISENHRIRNIRNQLDGKYHRKAIRRKLYDRFENTGCMICIAIIILTLAMAVMK